MQALPTISEDHAVRLFVGALSHSLQANWRGFRKALDDVCKPLRMEGADKLRIPGTGQAQIDLFIALFATELEALPNLFPGDQSVRLRERSIAFCEQALGPQYKVRQEVAEYHYRWAVSLRYPTRDGPDEVSYLCQKWGIKILTWEVAPDTTSYSTANPLLEMMLRVLLTDYQGIWKRITEQYQVVP